MAKSISLSNSQELLAKVTGGKNVPPAALPNEKLNEEKETQVSGNIEEIIAAEKKRLGVDTGETTGNSPKEFVPPQAVPLESLSKEKADEIAKSISTFSKPQEPKPEQKEEVNFKSETGADLHATICPRCSWDLSLPSGPAPDYMDKVKFVTALLAGKPFQKQYDLLDGKLLVTFRTLRPREIDACYEQIVHDTNVGKIKFQGDIIEMVNRYRFYLQLVEIKTKTVAGFMHEFPEGFTPKTNKKATTFWELPEDLPEGSLGLDVIETYMINEVFETESLHRMVSAVCRDFNRLVAQLEAMVDNENFWKPTETPS